MALRRCSDCTPQLPAILTQGAAHLRPLFSPSLLRPSRSTVTEPQARPSFAGFPSSRDAVERWGHGCSPRSGCLPPQCGPSTAASVSLSVQYQNLRNETQQCPTNPFVLPSTGPMIAAFPLSGFRSLPLTLTPSLMPVTMTRSWLAACPPTGPLTAASSWLATVPTTRSGSLA